MSAGISALQKMRQLVRAANREAELTRRKPNPEAEARAEAKRARRRERNLRNQEAMNRG